jgi:tetratricopeptide (TPR) repeat protein
MAEDPNTTGEAAQGHRPPAGGSGGAPPDAAKNGAARWKEPEVPPSKALQWFLLAALVISGAAYVVGLWTDLAGSQVQTHQDTMLRRLVRQQSAFLQHTQAGDAALARKRFDVAVSEYRLALEGQNRAEGHERLANALLKTGNPDAAFAQFAEALRLDTNRVSVYSGWGQALASQGNLDEAARIFHQGLQRNPDSGLLHYDLAMTLRQMQTEALSRQHVAAAAGKAPEAKADGDQAGRFAAEALSHYTKAGANGVDSAAFWCGYGELLNQQGQFADAQSCLLRAASRDTNLSQAHFQLAFADERLGQYQGAIDHYQKVLTLTPDDPATLNSLALLYATATNDQARSPKMAVLLATRACVATTSQNARYMDTLAQCYAADGDFFQAITWEDKALQRAMQLNDNDLIRELQPRYTLFVEHKTR